MVGNKQVGKVWEHGVRGPKTSHWSVGFWGFSYGAKGVKDRELHEEGLRCRNKKQNQDPRPSLKAKVGSPLWVQQTRI